MFPKTFLHLQNNLDLPDLVNNPLFKYLIDELKAQYTRNDMLAKSLAQVRADNASYRETCDQYRSDIEIHVANIVLAQNRIDELEFDFENLLDQYSSAVDELVQVKRMLLSPLPTSRRVRRRITFDEMIDLTTESDSDETTIEEVDDQEQ